MLQINEKSDTIKKSLDLSAPLQQQSSLKVSRKIIEFTDFQSKDTIITQDTIISEPQQSIVIQPKLTVKSKLRQTKQDSLPRIEPKKVTAIAEIPVQNKIILPEKQIMRKNSDWMIGIFVLCLIIFASVRIIFNNYLKQISNATINYSTSYRLFRERNFNILHASFRLDILFYIVFALFLHQSLSIFNITISNLKPFTTYLIVLGAVIAYYILKHLIYFLVSLLTESQNETAEYLFNVNIYNRILGLFLLAATMIIAFFPIHDVKLLFWGTIIVITAFYCLSLLRGTRILLKKHFSISYLILYLCTLEILPLLIIYKMVIG